jgi:thiol:disulfide interchange protein DsbC
MDSMRTKIVAPGLAAFIAASAMATTPPPKPAKAAPLPAPAAAVPATVPADVRARVVAKLPGATPADVAASPIPGLYEVTMGGLIAYVSADGKYLVSGSIYDLATETNLTAERRNGARAKALAAAREDQMIIFSPDKPKMTVTVFTDVDCAFCRKFHSQIADINKAGVRVRYIPFPRTGPDTESWHKAEAVWCSADRKDALTRAKRGEDVKSKKCGDAAIKAGFSMGEDFGLEGTPAIYTQSGEYIGGFLTPEQLVALVQESEKATGAAAASR